LDIYTPRGIELLSEFLRDVEKYGIGIKAKLNENGFIEANKQFFEAPNIILGDGT
jgi:uracil phosphoribosyltransferase